MHKLFSKSRTNKKDSLLHRMLQKRIASLLFPAGKGDWYALKGYGQTETPPSHSPTDARRQQVKASFAAFRKEQQENTQARYFSTPKDVSLSLNFVPGLLSNRHRCELEVLTCQPELTGAQMKAPGEGLHIVYFPGANTYYQACFRDIAAAAKETGASVHAFNFPGTGASTGVVCEANDLINAGIAVVNNLLRKGVHPDKIVLQGDCYGAAIACEVKKQFHQQANIQLRLIMNNAFKSFKAALLDIVGFKWLSRSLRSLIKKILRYTGWHVQPGKLYNQSGPYQCYIQHEGDQTLKKSQLAAKVKKYKTEMQTGQTTSKKRLAAHDTCPAEYRSDRDALDQQNCVRVTKEAAPQLIKKFGSKKGQANAHFADLCECETQNGESVYVGFVNKYLEASNRYLARHPQSSVTKNNLPEFLYAAHHVSLKKTEVKEIKQAIQLLKTNRSLSRRNPRRIARKHARSLPIAPVKHTRIARH